MSKLAKRKGNNPAYSRGNRTGWIVLVCLQYIESRNFPDVGFRFYLCVTSRITMKSQAASSRALMHYWMILSPKFTTIDVFLK